VLSLATIVCLLHPLNNGLTLVLLPSQLAPVVAVQAWVSVGSADEGPNQAGLSHVMEHMLFKGTARRGVGEIARDIEGAGGEINAWTSRDNTVFHTVMPSRYADVGIDVLSDALLNSTFDAQELEREREVILEEIRQGNDEPMRALAQSMFRGAFEHHPYRKPVIGNVDSVAGFTRADLLRFRDRWYRARNMALVVSGDFEPVRMRKKLEQSFANLSAAPAPRRNRKTDTLAESGGAHLDTAAIRHAQVALSFRAPKVNHADCAALDVLTVALGQGESSLLSTSLVRKRELCRSSYAYLHALRDQSLVVVGATADSEKLSKALPRIGGFIEKIRRERISASDLAKAKHAIAADTIYQRQTAEGAAQIAGSYLALTGDVDFESRYLKQVASLTLEDLQGAALRVLDPKHMNLAALVPEKAGLGTVRAKAVAANRLMSLVQKGISAQAKAKPTATSSSKAKASGIVKKQLANGMTLLIKRDTSVPLVAARATWSGGSLRETAKNAGISAITAELLTRGCGRMSAEEIIEEVDAEAASLSGFSGRNSLGLQAEWLADDWKHGLDLFSECLLSPHFDKAEFERSKRKQLARIRAQADSPSHQVFRLFQETLFRTHPYRRNSLGTEQSVGGLSESAVKRHYERQYPISGLTIAIVGDVDPTAVLARVTARFEKESAKVRPPRPRISEVFASRTAVKREVYGYMDREQAHLVIGFPGIRIDDGDRYALEALTTILGGQGGRLFVELRDRMSLAYQIGAYSLEGLDPGYVAIYLSCAPEKVEEAIVAVRAEIDGLLAKGVRPEELSRAKKYLIGTHEISLQRRSSVAAALSFHNAYGLDHKLHTEYSKRVSSVKNADVLRVLHRLFQWDFAVTAVVTPLKASPEAERRMRGVVRKRRRAKKARAH